MQKNIKYQGLLNNLLNIDPFDSSLYFKIDNENFFDVLQYFGKNIFNNILNNYKLNISLSNNSNKELITKLHDVSTTGEIVNLYKYYDKKSNLETPKKDFDFNKLKEELIGELELEQQKSILKWKKIINKANNINAENNIWPLHIGFFIVTIKTDKKNIFAPLFFKEVNLEIKNSVVYLYSNSEVKINEKLITFLNQEGFSLNVDDFDFSNLTINEIFSYFAKTWESIYEMPKTLFGNILKIKNDNINNKSIKFLNGMVLGFFNVSSGYLWNQLKLIVENDEFDNILNPDFDKNKYKERIKKVIFDDKFKLFKIQDTNYSQDVATISSLYQDTIIWGPPGTGKSQTITNLIVNIIARGYTGLVVSQKKAALDVLKNRLKKLGIFCLFALNDKNLRTENFYKPLKEFIYLVENFKIDEPQMGIEIFSEKDKHYIDNLDILLNIDNLEEKIELIFLLNSFKLDEKKFNILKELDSDIKYNFNNLLTIESLKNHLYQVNYQKKLNIFTIYPAKLKKTLEFIRLNDWLLKINNIDKIIPIVKNIGFSDYLFIDNFFKKQLELKTFLINDDLKLARMLLAKIVEKMNNFTLEEKRQYTSFAMAIRTAHLKPFKFFHKHKEMIKKLFPIIVTTPDVDLSIWKKQEFDFAILDESSQIFIEKGIPILYLAKRKILAGDSQQMQPTRWFFANYTSQEEDDFGNIESLLEYATARGLYSILLNKNYRSKHAALMTFSSKNFYNSKLDVIDDYNVNKGEYPIEVIQAQGVWENGVNEIEGSKLLDVLNDNIDKYSSIIALVFNSKQLDLVLNKIFLEHPKLEEAINKEKLSIKNIENIQGDEADLIVMSTVYDHTTSLHGAYVTRKGGKNALNVAVSRAREKIIVIKSINHTDIELNEKSTDDIRIFKEWLKFLDLTTCEQKNYLENLKLASDTDLPNSNDDNDFFIYVDKYINDLLAKYNDKYKIIKNYSLGTKSIDIAIINMENNLVEFGIIVDQLKYKNDYQEFLEFKDSIKFLTSKKYPIFCVSKLNFPWINKMLNDFIEQKNRELEKRENNE